MLKSQAIFVQTLPHILIFNVAFNETVTVC